MPDLATVPIETAAELAEPVLTFRDLHVRFATPDGGSMP